MAVHFDHCLDTEGAGINTNIGWLKNSPLLAVLSYSEDRGGSVRLFNEEGDKLPHKPIYHQGHPTSYAWHPSRKIIAVGWETGEIILWNEQDKELIDAPHLHRSEISVLHWSSNGTRLISADRSGVLIGWKSDSKGHLGQDPFQHHVQEPITQIILKPAPPPDPAMDISSLARAAVSGDESALDMFNWKRGGKNKMAANPFGPQESLSFFVGGASGGVYFLSDQGRCTQCFSIDTPVKKLLFYEDKNVLVTISQNLMLTQHAVFGEADTKEILKVKLSGKSENPTFIWAGKGLLATATGELVVRMWDLEQDDNYILTLEGNSGYDSNETIMCLAYNKDTGILAGGTNLGNVALWKYSPPSGSRKVDGDEKWKLQPPATVEGPIRQIEWSNIKGLMAVNTIANVYILSEQVMNFSYKDQTAVVQYGPGALSIEMFSSAIHHDIKTEIQVKGICTTKDTLAVWNGKRVIIYEYSSDKSTVKAAGTFATDATVITLYEQNVYSIEQNKVQVRTFQGTVKQLITFAEPEGHPVSLDVCGSFLVVATGVGILRVYDLSRREAKAHSSPKNLQDVIPGFGSVINAKVNCTGNRVSVQVLLADGKPDHKLYFWDVELDTVQYFNFETGRGEQDDYLNPAGVQEADNYDDTNDAERGKTQAAKDIAGRYPVSQYWDTSEPKLFVCEAWVLSETINNNANKKPSLTKIVEEGPVEVMIVSLFCTSENGILIQDSFSMPQQFVRLMGVEVPYYCFTQKGDTSPNDLQTEGGVVNPETGAVTYPKRVARKIMRDYVGLENSDKATRDAMMNFSFFLTVGNMDEAFKAIKLIKSESVWENMAKMCVKSRRLDVASVCLGNMGHARGAKALREALVSEPELDAKVAVLAIQLGLYEDAERLLKNCKRYDLLNEFYQNRGDWQKALETAEMYDRIHLRTTFYNYARHLEEQGEYQSAIPNYEKSETHKFEVPRMLADDPDQLEVYISKSQDKTLNRWWAQYMESTGDMETAIQYYEKAEDNFSLVRVYCFCSEMDKAAEICDTTKDQAACYYLARQYENQNQIKEAISFFQKAKAYGSAIRLCKEHGFEDQLLSSAIVGRPEDIMEAARYYETKQGQQHKAVMLYQKAGNYSKALELAFTTRQYDSLQQISSELDERANPELLQKCADFFLENGQYDKAVDMLAIGKKFWEAVKICMDQTVEITEELAEKLTPDKDFENDPMARIKILEAIAEVCMHQGAYHLATKKFTQAGNKIKAMKALLKSGDTEKIVFFAGVSRQREIYVMAANYLQSLDWRKDPEIMKNIIAFYTKGRALDALASFYDACAQVEIDEYQNYDKALGALGEAYKCMSKAKLDDSMQQEEKLGTIKHKMALIKKFTTARRTYQENSDEAIKQCQVLLEEKDLDSAVRVGDIYGFMIEHYASKERWKAAHALLDELQSRLPGIHLGYYVNMKTIEAIHRALSLPIDKGLKSDRMNGFRMGAGDNEDDMGEFVEEEVIDDSYSTGDKL